MYKDNMKHSFSFHSNDILFERPRKIFAGILITHDCNVNVMVEHHVLLFTLTNNPKDQPVEICFIVILNSADQENYYFQIKRLLEYFSKI